MLGDRRLCHARSFVSPCSLTGPCTRGRLGLKEAIESCGAKHPRHVTVS